MIRNGNALTVSILDPVLGAGKADLVVPVPGGASGVRRLSVVPFGENAGTSNKVVSLEAGQAVTVFGVRGA